MMPILQYLAVAARERRSSIDGLHLNKAQQHFDDD
jgi:hypothetical protein